VPAASPRSARPVRRATRIPQAASWPVILKAVR
jgi:hypothetical protein